MVAAAIVAITSLTGCGAKGAKFTEFEKPQTDKALVYVYRPDKFAGGGVYYDIHVDENVVGTLRNGGYIVTHLEPGKKELWAETEAKKSIILNMEANKMYCVRGGVTMGVFVGHPELVLVHEETCKSELPLTQASSD